MPSLRTEGSGRLELEVSSAALRAATLGAVSGLRSMTGPALLARAARRGDVALSGTAFGSLRRLAPVLQVLMVGEMVGDKAPFTPSRTSAGPLFGRVLSGALVGAALFTSEGLRGTSGASVGAVSAVLGAVYGERLRARGSARLGVPDVVLGHLEDGAALLAGTRLLRR